MDRIDEIKRRHSDRKRNVIRKGPTPSRPSYSPRYDYPNSYNEQGPGQGPVPSSKKTSFFLIKCMAAAALVLGVGIVQKEKAYPFSTIQSTVKTAMTNEFNFAGVSNWYESAFGSPLAILPFKSKAGTETASTGGSVKTSSSNLAVPVNGQVTQNFSQSKKGVTVQTSAGSSVDAVDSGYVLSVTNDKNTGKTVVIQHSNGDQSIYGKLSSVNVKAYDFVKKQQKIGTVSNSNNQGVFYFAFKEGNHYVDPIQVISFD